MTDLMAPGTPDDFFTQLQVFFAGGTGLARHLAVSAYHVRLRLAAGISGRDRNRGPAPTASGFPACHLTTHAQHGAALGAFDLPLLNHWDPFLFGSSFVGFVVGL